MYRRRIDAILFNLNVVLNKIGTFLFNTTSEMNKIANFATTSNR